MWVVKLGGSLWRSPELRSWLHRIAAIRQPLVVVPGGGPFADQVRGAQARWGFDDRCAHRMALLAMAQMAQMLCALQPNCIVVDHPEALASTLATGRVPVWSPAQLLGGEPGVDEDWRVTSDSLAVWLAGRLSARGLLLVKSAALPKPPADIAALQRGGLLDDAFHCYAKTFSGPVWVVHRAHSNALAAVLDHGAGRALRVSC